MKNNNHIPREIRVVQIVLICCLLAGLVVLSSVILHRVHSAKVEEAPEVIVESTQPPTQAATPNVNKSVRIEKPAKVIEGIIKESEDSIQPDAVDEASAPATVYMDMSEDDIHELATLVYLEAGVESFECQQGVASVVLNRMTTQGMTLQEVIYQKNQFTPAYLIPTSSPSESTLEAVRTVLATGPTLPEYVTYFRSNYYFSWATPYTSIDRTYFSYDNNVKEALGY